MYNRALTPQCNFAFVKTQLLISTSLTPLTHFLLSHADKVLIKVQLLSTAELFEVKNNWCDAEV